MARMAHASDPWHPTHRHRDGGLCRELLRGEREGDRAPVVVFELRDGAVRVATVAEVDAGLLLPLTQPAAHARRVPGPVEDPDHRD